ncbi:hypothetical protein [Mycolicibacterium sp. F2034L]|uniref:hypothetical protein n=1 Tax=Mycolicibacterium sp. F2034L TaxID=2926422 RepID=UPI001FF16AAB|nr:hypothetical protein [Mycolicibacterium sp. F2034L]MCK0174770.1 hypothetical protein [Mycolicibacterium sp. F2034L]
MTTRARWETGTAEVVAVNARGILVACPHCDATHEHTRGVLGSRAVVAGCHTGHSLLREYAITDLGRRAKPARGAAS